MEKIQNSPATPHKFDQPMKSPLTCRERVELEYTSQFIPYLKTLEKKIGHEQVIKSLQEYAFQGVNEFAEHIVEVAGKNDLSVIKEIYSPANPNLRDTLTMEVIESTEETYIVNVTECLLAEIFRKAGAADYGYASVCCDILFTRLVNPEIGLDLEGTIMEGEPSCMHRWYIKPLFEPATLADWPRIEALLSSSKLPLDGLGDHLGTTLVARIGEQIAGCAALELYGDCALLRSVAVEGSRQGQGLGRGLTTASLDLARKSGVRRVFLLTETASEFFSRFGFNPIHRSDVPEAVKQSLEFISACPVSALVMALSLERT